MALSLFRWLFVIARNSSFTYKGRAVDVKQVGRELGVRYVLEGSVRKAGNRIRIAGQLIDAETGAHLWAAAVSDADGAACTPYRCPRWVRLGKAQAEQNESAMPRAADISADAAGSRRRVRRGDPQQAQGMLEC